VRDIVQINLDQIAAGKLAADKAQSRAVRQHGRRMARDHMRLQAEASELGSARGMPLPAGNDPVEIRRLEKLPPAQFDRAYLELSARRRAELLRVLERAASRAADPALRAFAERALPTVTEIGL
jgi:putative membrane protein